MTVRRDELQSRWVFKGQIVLETALHIGGGNAVALTDSPVLRDAAGTPLIPGSSIKGAFRAVVERIAPNIPRMTSCGLFGSGDGACMTVNREVEKEYLKMREGRIDEEQLLGFLDKNLCDTCKLFGAPHLASKVFFADGVALHWGMDIVEVRDGVGINRDTDRAVDKIKFDFEVVPSGTVFDFQMIVENPTPRELGLLAIGLQEFRQGYVPLGGIKSRGLGRCKLEITNIENLDFTDDENLMAYLLEGKMPAYAGDIDAFIKEMVKPLFA